MVETIHKRVFNWSSLNIGLLVNLRSPSPSLSFCMQRHVTLRNNHLNDRAFIISAIIIVTVAFRLFVSKCWNHGFGSFDKENERKKTTTTAHTTLNAQNSLISSVELWNWFAMTWRTFDRYKCTHLHHRRHQFKEMSKHTNGQRIHSGWTVEQSSRLLQTRKIDKIVR